MATAFIMEFDGVGQPQYDAVMGDLDMDHNPPPGLMYHVAGPRDGGWRVIDVWDSEQSLQSFLGRGLGAAFQTHNIPEPKLTVFPVHNTFRPS